jgi:hypothetical protein
MGLLNQTFRSLKRNLGSLFKGKKKKVATTEVIRVPRSWGKPQSQPKAMPTVIKYKKRIPGLRWFKRILAGFLLLINFAFSQYLLGSIGTQAQPMFLLFLLNSFILIDYLWKTRRAE